MRCAFLICALSCCALASAQKPRFFSISWTFPAVQTKVPFSSTLLGTDSTRIVTDTSVTAERGGTSVILAHDRFVLELGAQPPSTWIGERPFRLRYQTLGPNQTVINSKDSIEAHFYHASFYVGVGYRFPIQSRNFDIMVIPYWQKQTGRFIVHDSLYSVYLAQKEMSGDQRNNLPDSIEVRMNELTQERTRDFSLGLRLNFSFGMTYKGAGLIFSISPRIQYSYLTVKEELFTRARSTTSNGLSYGGTIGIGLLIGEMPLGKKK